MGLRRTSAGLIEHGVLESGPAWATKCLFLLHAVGLSAIIVARRAFIELITSVKLLLHGPSVDGRNQHKYLV
jgi:hypothetical protein